MDPNANLEEQRRLTARIQAQRDNYETPNDGDVFRLAELVVALDEWIASGGFLPSAWKKP